LRNTYFHPLKLSVRVLNQGIHVISRFILIKVPNLFLDFSRRRNNMPEPVANVLGQKELNPPRMKPSHSG